MKSPEICNALYKRLASATLYQQVGPEYWCDYTGAILDLFSGGTNDSFDDKSWATIVEGWGYYMANTLTAEKYRGLLIAQTNEVAQKQISAIENFRVDNGATDGLVTDADGYRGWLACGFLFDLTDVGEQIGITGITDNVSQYKPLNIFKAYTRPVRDITGLKNELIARNAGLQQVQVEELFTSYGY